MKPVVIALVLCAGCDFAFRVDYHPPLDGAATGPDATSITFDAPPPSLKCPVMAMLCDGFESGDISAWSAPNIAGGSSTVDKLDVHSGVYALDAIVRPSTMNGAFAGVSYDFPAQSTGSLTVRLWVSFAAQMINYDTIVSLSNSMSSEYLEVTGDAAAHWDVVDTSSVTHGLMDHASTKITPNDPSWQCVEVDYTFPNSVMLMPTIKLFIADQMVVSASASDLAPVFDTISVGITRADQAGFATSTDDVVIATQHIGCQ